MEKRFYLSMQFIHLDKMRKYKLLFFQYSKITFLSHEPLHLILSFQTYTHLEKFNLT